MYVRPQDKEFLNSKVKKTFFVISFFYFWKKKKDGHSSLLWCSSSYFGGFPHQQILLIYFPKKSVRVLGFRDKFGYGTVCRLCEHWWLQITGKWDMVMIEFLKYTLLCKLRVLLKGLIYDNSKRKLSILLLSYCSRLYI